jgi:hypothetical protein
MFVGETLGTYRQSTLQRHGPCDFLKRRLRQQLGWPAGEVRGAKHAGDLLQESRAEGVGHLENRSAHPLGQGPRRTGPLRPAGALPVVWLRHPGGAPAGTKSTSGHPPSYPTPRENRVIISSRSCRSDILAPVSASAAESSADSRSSRCSADWRRVRMRTRMISSERAKARLSRRSRRVGTEVGEPHGLPVPISRHRSAQMDLRTFRRFGSNPLGRETDSLIGPSSLQEVHTVPRT